MTDLPPGFVLDNQPSQNAAPALPQGFVLDQPHGMGVGEALKSMFTNPPPGGLISAVKDLVTLPGDVATGKQPVLGQDGHTSDALIQRSARNALGFTPAGPEAGMISVPGGGARVPFSSPAVPAPAVTSPVQDAVAAANRIGVDVPKFMGTEGSVAPRLATVAKNIPFAGKPIEASTQKMVGQMGDVASGLAGDMGTASPDIAGGMAKDAIRGFIKKDSGQPVSAAYGAVDQLVDPNVRLPLTNTFAEAAKIMSERQNARINAPSGALNTVEQAINDVNGLNYEGAKQLRSYLGERTPQELIADGINPTEAKRLYGSLTEDLKSIVQAGGGDQALQAWQEANTLASQTAAKRQSLAKIVGSKGDASPEAVFSRLVAMSGSKSTADIGKLAQAKSAMGPEAWNEVGSAIVSRLGRDPSGNFSPDRFVTAYGNLSDSAKSLLFGGNRQTLDDLMSTSQLVQDKISKFSNHSNTAHVVVGTGLLTWLMSEPITTISSIVGGRALAQVLSRPAIAKSAADLARAQSSALSNLTPATQRAYAATFQKFRDLVGREFPNITLPVVPGNVIPAGAVGHEDQA